jgi:hypothetical protein
MRHDRTSPFADTPRAPRIRSIRSVETTDHMLWLCALKHIHGAHVRWMMVRFEAGRASRRRVLGSPKAKAIADGVKTTSRPNSLAAAFPLGPGDRRAAGLHEALDVEGQAGATRRASVHAHLTSFHTTMCVKS